MADVLSNADQRSVIIDCCSICHLRLLKAIPSPPVVRHRNKHPQRKVRGKPNAIITTMLNGWRISEFDVQFPDTLFFGCEFLLPDTMVTRIASFVPLESEADLCTAIPRWAHWDRAGASLWAALVAAGAKELAAEKVVSAKASATRVPQPKLTHHPSSAPKVCLNHLQLILLILELNCAYFQGPRTSACCKKQRTTSTTFPFLLSQSSNS